MDFSMLNNEFKTKPLAPSFVKIPKGAPGFLPLNSKSLYPWSDREYGVGDSFWVKRTEEQATSGKKRPNVPSPGSVGGRVWRTSAEYHEPSKEYGYRVTRVA
tara:strand:+ start:303 stop:608 length:306 start_codon:yes stop_codon:yes gene_type:complete